MQDNRRKFSDNEKQVLFDEVHGRCPICGKRLTHSKNGHIYRTFEVAHIYPANPKPEEEKLLAAEERLSDDVNSLKNVVAVCRICHKKFDTPRTIDEYRTWVRMKKKLLQENEIKDNYALFNIEDDIAVVMKTLNSVAIEEAMVPLKITDKLNIRDAPKFAVEKVVDLAAQIKQLSDENGYFAKAQSIDDSLKAATSDLAALKELALDDICNQVNTKMYELNKKIYGDSRRAPTLNIHGDRYSFSTYGDTGTGTAFANLITFDLALLDLTCLPAVAHDLPLLKNIENPAMEKIILLYAASKKQIFIAIDKIHSYDKVASSVVETHGVIQLSKDKTLFIKNWKNATT